MDEYKVQLDVYSGPLDLLLFLIRRDEVDIRDIPIARVTEQYLKFVDVLRELDPEAVSEFLVLAATLMEIKSRMLLPHPPPEEVEVSTIDPRLELVRQLLEYKAFKDASRVLEAAAETRAQRYSRAPAMPPRDESELELDRVDVWDLLEAFKRLLEQTGKAGGVHEVRVDDTPLALHAADILDSLERAGGEQEFETVFGGRTRPEMIGLFLALLELLRQRRVRAVQDRALGPIRLHLLLHTGETLDEDAARPEYHEYDEPIRPLDGGGVTAGGTDDDATTDEDEG